MFLPDHILIQLRLDLHGFGNGQFSWNKPLLSLFRDDLVAEFNAFITDVDCRAGNELSHFVLTLPTKGAVQDGPIISSVRLHLLLLSGNLPLETTPRF